MPRALLGAAPMFRTIAAAHARPPGGPGMAVIEAARPGCHDLTRIATTASGVNRVALVRPQ